MNDSKICSRWSRQMRTNLKPVAFAVCLAFSLQFASGKEQAVTTPQTLPAENSGFSGKVIETTNAASYTYIQVDTGTRKVWAAAPQFAVKVGDSVEVAAGMPMPNYHSKTLERDFDVVYFTATVTVNGSAPAAAASPSALPKDHPPISGTTPKIKVDLTGIQKAEGGRTIAELYAARPKLSGQPVKVRGKVVKFSAMIMGKNWLHIQDGTGDTGSNDLTVTTSSQHKVGDTVLVVGTLATDKDFGAGYKYSLIVEDAKVTAE